MVVLLRKGHDDTVDPHATLLDDETPRKEGEEHTMLYCANVGDSKAVLCRSGKAVELSYDHKPTRPDEKARIIEAGGSVVTGRLFGVLGVSRSFGDVRFKPSIVSPSASTFPPVSACLQIFAVYTVQESGEPMPLIAEPEVLHEQLCPEDEFVVLACDGVWDVMSPANVVCYVRRRLLEHGDPQQAAEELTQKALDLNSIDNVSAIVVRFPNMKKK